MMENIMIIGATSAIAKATARLFAHRGDRLYLFARDEERLFSMAKDLKIRGAASVVAARLDVNDFAAHEEALNAAFTALEKVDLVLIAHGTLPEQEKCERDFNVALTEINTNALSVVSLLTVIANRLESQKSGTIAVISSVAGDRGRQSNYLYGTAKAMVSVFLQGLRNRLHKSAVNVVDIKPGFVDTPMTKKFKKGFLWAKPEKIAAGIQQAIRKRKSIVYLPWFWRYIMLVIRCIPERIFRRLKL